MTLLEQLKKEQTSVMFLGDFYFEKFQKSGDQEDKELYLDYRGQETGLGKAIDLLSNERGKLKQE